MSRLSARLPATVKRVVWALLDRLPALPLTLRAGPAAGLVLYAPLRYRAGFRSGLYEPQVVAALGQLARPGMTVIELGSHVGYHTLALARLVGPAGRVWAFEPLPRHLELLRRSCRRNRLGQVRPVGLAAGAVCGRARLVEPALSTMSFLADDAEAVRGGRLIEVERAALDVWAESVDLPGVDLVKLDIEGAELRAIEGAVALLARCRPAIVCEVHCGVGVPDEPRRLVDRLEEIGYRVEPIPRLDAPRESLGAILERAERTVLPTGRRGTFHLLAVSAGRE